MCVMDYYYFFVAAIIGAATYTIITYYNVFYKQPNRYFIVYRPT